MRLERNQGKHIMHIAIVKFNGFSGRPGAQTPAELWKAELVGLNGLRLPCRTPNHNPGGYICEEYARCDAKPYADLTGWPVVVEDQTNCVAN